MKEKIWALALNQQIFWAKAIISIFFLPGAKARGYKKTTWEIAASNGFFLVNMLVINILTNEKQR